MPPLYGTLQAAASTTNITKPQTMLDAWKDSLAGEHLIQILYLTGEKGYNITTTTVETFV